MQLKQAQKAADNEKMQKMQQIENMQQQWSQKHSTATKERDNVKIDLDLKQLEIINLREKLRDLKFHSNNLNDSTVKDFNPTQSFRNKRFASSTLLNKKQNAVNQTENNSINFVPTSSQLGKLKYIHLIIRL